MPVNTRVLLSFLKTNPFSSTQLVSQHHLTKMRLKIIFIALCLVRKSIQKVEFYGEKTIPTDQILCVKMAFETFSNDHSSLLIFSTKPNDIVSRLPRFPYYLATKSDSVRKISSIDSSAMIIHLEGNAEQDFTDLKDLLGIATMQPVLIVCVANAVCSSKMYINEIVKMVNGAQLHYVAVNDEGIMDIYEYTTTAEGDCGVAQLVRLGHCSDESVAKKALQTSVNFHECPIRLVNRFYPPYSYPCDLSHANHSCGLEGGAVASVVKSVNATPVLLTVQTPTDVRQLAGNGYADLGFGKLHMRPSARDSYSMVYMFLQSTIVAPYSTWARKVSVRDMVLPLKLEVWVGVVVVVVSVFILRILVPYFRSIHSLQLYGMILGIAMPRQPRRLPGRIFFLSVVFFGYVCSQSYLANLTKVLSTSGQPMINTMDDLENSNVRVKGSSDAREIFKSDYPRIYRDFQVVDHSEYYSGVAELLAGHSGSAFYVEARDVMITSWKGVRRINNQFWFPIAMVVPKSSAVLKTTNKVLTSLLESGILDADMTHFLIRENRYPKLSDSESLGKSAVLDLKELRGAFFLLIAGLSLSFLVFLIEIMTPFIKRKMRGGLKRKGQIHPEWLGQRHVRGILLPGQASRASRR